MPRTDATYRCHDEFNGKPLVNKTKTKIPVMLGEPFDPNSEFSIEETCRPHWSQSGAVVFVTFRTADSIPKKVIDLWDQEKKDWLSARGYVGPKWTSLLPNVPPAIRKEFNFYFNRSREEFLDQGAGECHLKQPDLSRVVADSLLYFDKQRYRMGDFVVMPNHVHLLCVFQNAELMREQFDSWQHFTATQINKKINRKGKFWQGDPFDHLVRSPEQYDYLRGYIARNPIKAGLSEGEYFYRRFEQ